MKKTYFLTALLVLFGLTGCAAKKQELAWLPYQALDGSTQAIGFMQISDAWGQKTAKQGTALQKVNFGDIETYQELGEIYYIYDVNQQPMRVMLLNGKQSVNPHDPDALNILSQSQRLDFYEFGKGRIGHAQFTANSRLCADFASKKGVNLRMVTNYYATENQYFSSLITAKIFRDIKPQNAGYKASFFIDDKALLAQIQKEEQQHGKRLAIENLMEKVSLLAGVVCQISN